MIEGEVKKVNFWKPCKPFSLLHRQLINVLYWNYSKELKLYFRMFEHFRTCCVERNLLFMQINWALLNSAPTPSHPHPHPLTPTHPHSPKIFSYPLQPTWNNAPHTQNNAPYTPNHSHLRKIMPFPPPRTQNNPHSLKIMPTNCQSHKLWSNNSHLLKLIFDHELR